VPEVGSAQESCHPSGARSESFLQQTWQTMQRESEKSDGLLSSEDLYPIEVVNETSIMGGDADDAGLCWKPPRVIDGLVQPGWKPTYVDINATCPIACPFTQLLSGEFCYKACVRDSDCKMLHPFRMFADTRSMSCAETCGSALSDHVLGCAECESPGVCGKCSMFRSLRDHGKACVDDWRLLWTIIYGIVMSIFSFIALYVIHLNFRPTVNTALMSRAETHRELTKPWKLSTQPDGMHCWKRYPMRTRTDKEDISGVGTALYFRWLYFLMFCAVFLLVTMYITFNVSIERVRPWAQRSGSTSTSSKLAMFGADSSTIAWQPLIKEAPLGNADGMLTTRPRECPPPNASLADGKAGQLLTPSLLLFSVSVREDADEEAESLTPFWRGLRSVLLGDRGTRWRPRGKPRGIKKVKIKFKTAGGSAEPTLQRPAGDPRDFPARMCAMVLVAYVVITIMSLAFSREQRRFALKWNEGNKSHADYALLASCLPAEATNPGELKVFFQEVLDAARRTSITTGDDADYKVVGVSIAYNYYREQEIVNRATDQLIEKLNDRRILDKDGAKPLLRSSSLSDASDSIKTKSKSCFWNPMRVFHTLDHMLLEPEGKDDVAELDEMTRQALSEMKGTGFAYVVVSSEHAKELMLLTASPPRFMGMPICIADSDSEPMSILWENYGYKGSALRTIIAICTLVSSVLLWAAFYVPYAYYSMTAVAVPGEEVGHVQDTVLGLLIAIGNQLVATVIESVVKSLNHVDKERRDGLTMILIFLATASNALLDLGLLMVIMRGMMLEQALTGFDSGHYDRVFARELMALIVPGYLITPYLVEPIFEHLVPPYVFRRLVGSIDGAPPRSAERKLMCPAFNATWRFADMLSNWTICLSLLMFTTPNLWKIQAWMIGCIALLFVLDHVRLLRHTQHSFWKTEELSRVFSIWWSVPTGYLGSIGIHWAIEAKFFGLIGSRRDVWTWMVMFGCVHCALYCTILHLLRGSVHVPIQREGENYNDMHNRQLREARVFDHFNTNPVHILRSWFFPWDEAEKDLVPYALGKEHLFVDSPSCLASGAGVAAKDDTAAIMQARLNTCRWVTSNKRKADSVHTCR